ncbi:MAG: hypothetical protein M1837_005724 [Sclerophora amabilis]|nr:MAG: hypothetical protein M1837_005724 [Sclerophora amabilis]
MSLPALPMELVQRLAVMIEDDRDLCNLSATCRTLHHSIVARSWVLKSRFNATYDAPHTLRPRAKPESPEFLKILYQQRQSILHRPIKFFMGKTPAEKRYLMLMRHLILESSASENQETGIVSGRNLGCLEHFACSVSSLVRQQVVVHPVQYTINPLLLAIQLTLAHLYLRPVINMDVHHFEISQQTVYAPMTQIQLYIGNTANFVNLGLLNHILNFFKYHLTVVHEGELYHLLKRLEEKSKPSGWPHILSQTLSSMNQNWIGQSGRLEYHDLLRMRSVNRSNGLNAHDNYIYSDIFSESAFEELEISMGDDIEFPEIHRMCDAVEIDSPVGEYIRLAGSGIDSRDFRIEGRLYSLPEQQEIPGWQRVVFARWHPDEDPELPITPYWIYEGCILPGGEIMLGRWYAPSSSDWPEYFDSGPFIYWTQPSPPADSPSSSSSS